MRKLTKDDTASHLDLLPPSSPSFPTLCSLLRSSSQPPSHCDLPSKSSDSSPFSLRWRRPSLTALPAFLLFLPLFLLSQATSPDEGRAPPPWGPPLLSPSSALLPPLALARKYSPPMAWLPFPSLWTTNTRTPRVATLQPHAKNARLIAASAVYARNPACGPDMTKSCKL